MVLWTIIIILATLWWMGLMTGYTMGSFIHALIAAAVILLVISINREVSIYQELKKKLKETARGRKYKKINSGGIDL
jgi:multisubunit Na+/H+ antiporter MnhE subunit